MINTPMALDVAAHTLLLMLLLPILAVAAWDAWWWVRKQ
jgi:hypothetical protein